MHRVVKEADVRRKELLDTALGLFISAGYEKTSIERITEAVGVAKGTFYHYFDSKQELVEALVTDYTDEHFERLERLIRGSRGDGVTRFRQFFAQSFQWKAERPDVWMAFGVSLYSDENVRLREKLMKTWSERLGTMFTEIVSQGAREGLFHVSDPAMTADSLLCLWYGWAELRFEALFSIRDKPEALPGVRAAIASWEDAMERLLGLPPSTLALGDSLTRYLKMIADAEAKDADDSYTSVQTVPRNQGGTQ